MSVPVSPRRLPAAPRDKEAFLAQLRATVGAAHVLTRDSETRRYRFGFRFGSGPVVAVVRPASLVELWRVAEASIASGRIVIMQAANTGLTGGSTPDGDDYDREVVLINTLRMKRVQLISGGTQVVCFPGATLDLLEKTLAPLGREPHSVIGSSCLGATVFGGISNNSGGSLVNRGPAYTELALFGQVGADGVLRLVNHLGIELGDDPVEMLSRLDAGAYGEGDITPGGVASDPDYARHVRDIEADTPARFNADPRRLHEASGSAGRLVLFAVRLDTFPKEPGQQVFYIGTNLPSDLTAIRRHILSSFETLPISGEYMHREAFDIAEVYGKDTFLTIRMLGTRHLPAFFTAKSRFDALAERIGFLPRHLSDRLLQAASRLFPNHLPPRMKEYRDRFEHHLLLKVPARGVDEARQFLDAFFGGRDGAYFACTEEEGQKAFLHRFAAAGAAVRYNAIHESKVGGIVALDIALRRNDPDWFETLPDALSAKLEKKLYYGHFLCHVLHQDYIARKGVDPVAVEHEMWALLDARGAEYPAEHNVGHLYKAKETLTSFYRRLDPCNCLNPGLGGTPKCVGWGEGEGEAAEAAAQ